MRQPGEVNDPDAVYKTVADLERGALSVYGSWTPLTEIEFNSVFTDEVAIGRNNGGQGINDGLYTFILQPGSDAPAGIWSNGYAMINFANRILAAAEKITPEVDEEADYNRIVAEMKGVRAYMHFNLLSYFSEDLTDDNELGVMLLDFVPDYEYNTMLPRSTNGEVFAFIEQDLTDLTTTLSSTDYSTWNAKKDRITIHFANALRARMNIYREHYADALVYSSKFVADNGNPVLNTQFPMPATAAAWAAMLANTSDGECIFKLRQISGDPQVGALFNSQSSSITGSPFYELSRSLYNLYGENDYRRGPGKGTNIIDGTSYVISNAAELESAGDYRNEDVLVINKYPGNTAQGDNLLNDFMIFRVGEMFLIKAEAYVGMGNLIGSSASAQIIMSRLRQRRAAGVSTPAYTSATQAWADILTERRRELALEGHRWLDIKRLGVKAGGLGVDRYHRDCENYNACTLDPTSYKFTLPIPTVEIIANTNIAGQQNTGY